MSDQRIVGFIDSISGDRVYGWVWDREEPERRLEVEIRDGDRRLGAVVADLPRPDLRMNGIGDGRYAFEFLLNGAEVDPLHLRALVRPAPDAAPVEVPKSANAVNPELLDTGKALFRLIELFEMLHGNQVAVARSLPASLGELRGAVQQDLRTEVVRPLDGLAAASGAGFAGLEKRLSDLEVFVTRIDATLRSIDRKVEAAAVRRDDRALRLMVGALLAVVLAAVGAAAVLYATP
ncbi:hypothetical protein [Azospirillum sp. ST 5-10]|uniref:hypothetical protein n=1 Tax=unclassified Azospirillum TaxID=2630922 RepID=UPI003F49B871